MKSAKREILNLKGKLGLVLKKFDATQIADLYKQYLEEGPNEQCACMLINLAGAEPFSVDVGLIGDAVFSDYPKKTEALYSAYIRYLILKQKPEEAFKLFMEAFSPAFAGQALTPHIRTITPFFTPGIKTERFEFLIEQYGSILDPLDTLPVIPSGVSPSIVESLLMRASNLYHELPLERHKEILSSLRPFYGAATETKISVYGECNCGHTLGQLDISIAERELMMASIPIAEKLRAMLVKGKYDYIVDGANVALHSGGGEFDCKKIEKVLAMLFPSRVLVVFHVGRRRSAAAITKRENVDYYYSDRKENDDLSWMYATLFLNAQCVTGDQMADHFHYLFSKVVPRHVFEKWVECHIIRYDFHCPPAVLTLSFPGWYSKRIHVSDAHVHIPFGADASAEHLHWFCLKN